MMFYNRSETYTYDERHNHLTKRIQAGGSDTTDYYTMNTGDQLTERVKKLTQSQVVTEEEAKEIKIYGQISITGMSVKK